MRRISGKGMAPKNERSLADSNPMNIPLARPEHKLAIKLTSESSEGSPIRQSHDSYSRSFNKIDDSKA